METFSTMWLLFCLTPLICEVRGNKDSADNKSLLRYGFQKTSECKDFAKAYVCVRKCLDLNFDIGHSDKECKCKCYRNRDKAAFTKPRKYNATKWRLGAPTTKKPLWAIPPEEYTKTQRNEDGDKDSNLVTVSGNSSFETNKIGEGNATVEGKEHSPAVGEEDTTSEDPNHSPADGEVVTTVGEEHSSADGEEVTTLGEEHSPADGEEVTTVGEEHSPANEEEATTSENPDPDG